MNSRAIYSPEPHRGWMPWGALVPFLTVFFFVVPEIPISLTLVHFGLVNPKGLVGFQSIALFLLLAFLSIGAAVLCWVRFVERRPLATIGLKWPGGAGVFTRGHLIGCGSIVAVILVTWLAGGYEATAFGPAWQSPGSLLKIAALLLCFCVQGGVEEIVFRGWMLSAIARKFNLPWAIGLSSLLFCLMHFKPGLNWLVYLNLVLFALFACAWSLKRDNIWGIMGWHAGWNWLLATGFQLPVTGIETNLPALLAEMRPEGSDYLTGGGQGPEGGLAFTLLSTGAIIYLLLSKRRGSSAPAEAAGAPPGS